MITLYWSPRTSAARIYWALEELAIPFEKVKIDIAKGEQKKPEYLALNPNGKVPLIVDDGVPIFESMAILIHLGQRYGQDKGLWPKAGAKAHGPALAWVAWAAATLQPTMFRYMFNTGERFPAEARNEKQGEMAKAELDKLVPMVEAELGKNPFMLGETFTYVDLAVASALGFWKMMGQDFSAFPRIAKWIETCQARAAFKAAMAAQ
jgi:glutathione S-transferase